MDQALDAQAGAHDSDLHAHVCAYNMAFAELGLRFRWDAHTLASLGPIDDEAASIAAYIESHHPHLLKAYSPEFLSGAILARKRMLEPRALVLRDPATTATSRASRPFAAQPGRGDAGEFGVPALAGA